MMLHAISSRLRIGGASARRGVSRTARVAGVLAVAAAVAVPLFTPHPAEAWWARGGWGGWGWGGGVRFGVAVPGPVVAVPPPVVVGPPVYAPPYRPYRPVWVPPHWQGGYWVPGHWA